MSTLQYKLENQANVFTHKVYFISRYIPKDELFGLTSQLRRAAVSVPCNIIEGFARDDWNRNKKELLRFLEIAYGSLSESKYLLKFIFFEYKLDQDYINDVILTGDKLGGLLFAFIKKLRKSK